MTINRIDRIRVVINYFLPREILGPVLIVFSLENVVDILFQTYMPDGARLTGWVIIAVLAALIVKEWGEADEDIEELEEDLEELESKG